MLFLDVIFTAAMALSRGGLPDSGKAPATAKIRGHSVNQKLADAIVAKVQVSADTDKADLDFEVTDGVVVVRGSVATEVQKKAILDVVRRVDGVKLIKDGIKAADAEPLMPPAAGPPPTN